MRYEAAVGALVCGLTVGAAGSVRAEVPEGWSGSIDLVSDYVFRGVSQNNRDLALQAGVEYEHGSGFYAGVWGSNVSWLSDGADDVSNSLEFDGYLGWRTEFDGGIAFDVGVTQYYYPGDYPAGFTRPYTTEPYLSVGFAGFTLGYAHSVTNLFGFDDSKNSGYLSLGWEHEFDGGWTVGASAGRQRIANDSEASYSDWSASIGKSFDSGFGLSLTYVDTNADQDLFTNAFGEKLADAALVLGVSFSF